MAELDFPSSPTIGDTYVAGGRTWQWNGTYWGVVGSSGVGMVQSGNVVPASATGAVNFIDTSVTFPTPFSAVPTVTTSIQGSLGLTPFLAIVVAGSVTTTGCTLRLFKSEKAPINAGEGAVPINWMASDALVTGGGGGGGGDFDGNHVLTGDPTNPPAELLVNQLLWDGDSTLVSSGTDWVGFPFQNSWTNYGYGWQAPQYRRLGDTVELRGLALKATDSAAGEAIATLPVGFRPPAPVIYNVRAGSNNTQGSERIDISAAGVITRTAAGISSAGADNWVTFAGVTFSVTA